MANWTNARYCDVANLILGAFLFLSHWIFGFGGTRAAENANIAGIVIAALAIAALATFAVWEECAAEGLSLRRFEVGLEWTDLFGRGGVAGAQRESFGGLSGIGGNGAQPT